MRNTEQLLNVIPHSSFVKIDNTMYRVDGHIIEEEEKMIYILHEDSGEQYVYDLTDTDNLKDLQNAEFYELTIIKE